MNADEFIKQNPFPDNGTELNNQLVRAIQDPSQSEFKEKNIETLFRVNARLIWRVYLQYSYGNSLDSVMSFMYEGIRKASEQFKESIGMPFYHYAMLTTRSLMQRYHNYHDSLIHVPVRKKKDIEYIFNDVNDYVDGDALQHEAFILNDDDDILDELFELANSYARKRTMTDDMNKGISIILQLKDKPMSEVCRNHDITESELRKLIKQVIPKLKKFGRM